MPTAFLACALQPAGPPGRRPAPVGVNVGLTALDILRETAGALSAGRRPRVLPNLKALPLPYSESAFSSCITYKINPGDN